MSLVAILAMISARCLVGRIPAGRSWTHMKHALGRRQAREWRDFEIKAMWIATGETEEEYESDGKNPAGKAHGVKGGKAQAANLTGEQRSEIARRAAAKRGGKRDA